MADRARSGALVATGPKIGQYSQTIIPSPMSAPHFVKVRVAPLKLSIRLCNHSFLKSSLSLVSATRIKGSQRMGGWWLRQTASHFSSGLILTCSILKAAISADVRLDIPLPSPTFRQASLKAGLWHCQQVASWA